MCITGCSGSNTQAPNHVTGGQLDYDAANVRRNYQTSPVLPAAPGHSAPADHLCCKLPVYMLLCCALCCQHPGPDISTLIIPCINFLSPIQVPQSSLQHTADSTEAC
jgi:hypothetical protein